MPVPPPVLFGDMDFDSTDSNDALVGDQCVQIIGTVMRITTADTVDNDLAAAGSPETPAWHRLALPELCHTFLVRYGIRSLYLPRLRRPVALTMHHHSSL